MAAKQQAVTGSWTKKPRSFPSGLSVHKRGWCARINGKVTVIAGKNASHEEVLARYYRKKAGMILPPTQIQAEGSEHTLPFDDYNEHPADFHLDQSRSAVDL